MNAAALAEVVHGQNVRMLKVGDGARLLLKAAHEFWAGGEFFGQHFHRHVAIHRRVVGFVHRSHTALPDLADDAIGA